MLAVYKLTRSHHVHLAPSFSTHTFRIPAALATSTVTASTADEPGETSACLFWRGSRAANERTGWFVQIVSITETTATALFTRFRVRAPHMGLFWWGLVFFCCWFPCSSYAPLPPLHHTTIAATVTAAAPTYTIYAICSCVSGQHLLFYVCIIFRPCLPATGSTSTPTLSMCVRIPQRQHTIHPY